MDTVNDKIRGDRGALLASLRFPVMGAVAGFCIALLVFAAVLLSL